MMSYSEAKVLIATEAAWKLFHNADLKKIKIFKPELDWLKSSLFKHSIDWFFISLSMDSMKNLIQLPSWTLPSFDPKFDKKRGLFKILDCASIRKKELVLTNWRMVARLD